MINEVAIEVLKNIITDLKWSNEWTEEREEAMTKAIDALSKKVEPEDLNFE